MARIDLKPYEGFHREGKEWDRWVVKRKDTDGTEQVIGKTQIRKDGISKVIGSAEYGADVNFPGQLYGVCARSPYGHARILSINTEKAEAVPGVKVVITGKDYPEPYGQFIADQPIIALDKVRYQGEPVAAVAAETEEAAREAARLVEVEYEELPVVNDLEESMKNETLIHEDWSKYECSSACFPKQGTNIGDEFHLNKGDVEKGFAEADMVIESKFRCGQLQHTLIETHTSTAIANPLTQEIQVWTPNQSPFGIRGLMGKIFGIPAEKVRLTLTEIGGAFGGKYEAKCEPIAIALSLTEVRMRVWERGAGETLACGTGACAVGVSCALTGRTEPKILVRLQGGELEIEWDRDRNRVFMTGPALKTFTGELTQDFFSQPSEKFLIS